MTLGKHTVEAETLALVPSPVLGQEEFEVRVWVVERADLVDVVYEVPEFGEIRAVVGVGGETGPAAAEHG